MKNIILYLSVGLALLLIQCTPKVATDLTQPTVTEVMEEKNMETWRSAAPSAGPARKIKLGEYNVFDLANGLKVIVVENHKLPRVSYSISLNNEPELEGDAKGYVGFAGQMMSRGTTTKSKTEIDKAIDQIGASMSAFDTGIFGSSLTKHQDKVLSIMSDVLFNPSFPQEEFEKVKKQTLSGLQSSLDDPNTMAQNISSKLVYGSNHPYGEVQTEESTNNITVDDCKKYYNTYFKPNNAYLTIVGDITVEEAKANAEKYFGSWKKGTVPTNSYDTPQKPAGSSVAFANKDGAVQSVISITYPVELKPASQEAIEASLMNSILGGGIFSGRLMQNLREDKAYTYGARSSISSDRLIGRFSAGASVRNEVTDSSIVQFLYEMERMASEPVSEEDLQLSKNSLAGSFARSLESPQSLARFARNIVRYDLPEDYYANYLEKLDRVTVADVQNVAKKYITADNAHIVVVGNKDEIADKLSRFDSDGEIDFYDAFGNKLEIADTPLPDDITAQSVVSKYLDKIGGADKWNALKTMHMEYGMNMMGMDAKVEIFKKAPGMMAMKVGTEAMTFQEQVFDGKTLKESAMGNAQTFTEGPKLVEAKASAAMLAHSNYLNGDYMLELKGVDQAAGESCYKLSVKEPSGKEKTEFYSVKNGLLLKEVITSEMAPGQVVTVTQEFGEYKEVDGLMIPHTIKTIGAAPQPISMMLKSIEVNGEIDDSKFVVE